MNVDILYEQIIKKQSFLCVGLDTDIQKIPKFLLDYENPVLEFNKRIIEATAPYCVAYKPNIAFYEMMGSEGWITLQKTLDLIPDNIFTIADAKRGDIGNTSGYYAKTYFSTFNFDAVTVAPYMGKDSVEPFLAYDNKYAILLALTSNTGASDFQTIRDKDNRMYCENVIEKSKKWTGNENLMYVVGATQTSYINKIRSIVPDAFLLIPGVGAQGGSLEDVKDGLNNRCGLLVNSSRGIIYAGSEKNFDEIAADEAKKIQLTMQSILKKRGLT